MGWQCPPAYGKKTEFYKKKIEKLDEKIRVLKAEKAVYEELIAEEK